LLIALKFFDLFFVSSTTFIAGIDIRVQCDDYVVSRIDLNIQPGELSGRDDYKNSICAVMKFV